MFKLFMLAYRRLIEKVIQNYGFVIKKIVGGGGVQKQYRMVPGAYGWVAQVTLTPCPF